jgi:hypothetical protein
VSAARARLALAAAVLLAAGPALADGRGGDVSEGARVEERVEGSRPGDRSGDRDDGSLWRIRPFAALVGGVEYETLQTSEDDRSEDRGVTIALSRLGLRGDIGDSIYVESEFEINAGPHGTSVWEGQAALQVRNQLIRVMRYGFAVDAGRITDDSSLDYFSEHVADQLLTDGFTRSSILASGFNRGNGILVRYDVPGVPGLRPGITVNAANPTSTTASLVVGGTFPPFSRFYFAPHQQVGRDASKFPADEFHILMVTPSVVYRREMIEAQGGVQLFRVNTNTSTDQDQPIDGFNIRAGVAGHLWDGRLHPFANFSLVQNEVVDPDDGMRLSGDVFRGLTVSGGLDYNYLARHGVGVQYALIRDQQGDATRFTQHFVNLGSTFWLSRTTALGARVGVYLRCEDLDGTGCPDTEGERSYFMTVRTLL